MGETAEQRAARHAASHAQLVASHRELMASTSPVAINAALAANAVVRAIRSRQSAVDRLPAAQLDRFLFGDPRLAVAGVYRRR